MKMEEAVELAASAWCKEITRDKPMDVELAAAFADILMQSHNQFKPGLKVKLKTPAYEGDIAEIRHNAGCPEGTWYVTARCDHFRVLESEMEII